MGQGGSGAKNWGPLVQGPPLAPSGTATEQSRLKTGVRGDPGAPHRADLQGQGSANQAPTITPAFHLFLYGPHTGDGFTGLNSWGAKSE